MDESTTPKLSLVGNDSQHVVFTEASSGKAEVCGLKGGVHLLKYFLENLRDPEQATNLGKAMQIELQSPHWSIELSKKKRKKEGKNDEMEEFFRVDRLLHIRDPSLDDTLTRSAGHSTTVLLLEDPVPEREYSMEEIWKLFRIVSNLRDKVLVCKISRPLSKEYKVNFPEVLNNQVTASLRAELSEKKATENDAALLAELQKALAPSETGILEKVITGLGLERMRYYTDDNLSKLLEEKKVQANDDLLEALNDIRCDIKVSLEAAHKPLLNALLEKYASLKFPPVIIVDAEDLRKEGVQLSYHLSWSRTVEEFKRFLSGDSLFAKDLKDFQQDDRYLHLIVRFGCDGVIHCQTNKRNELSLFYANSKFVEGDYVQDRGTQMIGEATAFTAGLVHNLAKDAKLGMEAEGDKLKMKAAISYGMKAACRLVDQGFQFDTDAGFIYPTISPETDTSGASADKLWTIKTEDISKVETGRWSVLTSGDSSRSMLDLAKDIVQKGTKEALQHKPTAQFGELVTVDREEMENFRGIANLVRDYMKTPQTKPLSIGVFGFPGSGKSFGVGEVIKAVASGQGKEIAKLEFNLSQFLEYSDLLAAFQSIRDQTFSNKVPVVMFDEFDCSFGGKALGWLQYFLAPMQDGKFLERGQLRPLGSAIFIFVGGTSPTFGEFQATARERDAVAAKKPDFISRLRGSVDIWGPNKLSSRNDGDKTYTVRRAIILRSLLKRNKYLDQKGKFEVADNVLNALLCVSGFHHGTRSLEAIIKMSKITPGQKFTAAGLPSDDRLIPYIDPIVFGEWLKNWRDGNERKRLAIEQAIYNKYPDPNADSRNWEPNWEETMLLSKAVAENISNILDAGKASDLTNWQQPPTTAKSETTEEETVVEATQAEPAAKEPAAQELAAQEPAAQEPAVQEPAVQEPAVQESAVQEPAAQESDAKEADAKEAERRSKIKKIAEGVYYLHKAIRSNRRTTVEMIMPWWFIEQQNTPRNRYFEIADVVWQALITTPQSPTSGSSPSGSSPSGSSPSGSPNLNCE